MRSSGLSKPGISPSAAGSMRVRTSVNATPSSPITSVTVSTLEIRETSTASKAAWPTTANQPNSAGARSGPAPQNPRTDTPVNETSPVCVSRGWLTGRRDPPDIPGATQLPLSHGTNTTSRCSGLSSRTAAISSRAESATGTRAGSAVCATRVATATAGCCKTAALNGFSLRSRPR